MCNQISHVMLGQIKQSVDSSNTQLGPMLLTVHVTACGNLLKTFTLSGLLDFSAWEMVLSKVEL